MKKEIERRFWVKDSSWKSAHSSCDTLVQGYIVKEGNVTVRVRTKAGRGFLTIKAPSSGNRIERAEFEYEIPHEDALSMLEHLAQDERVIKQRYNVPHGDLMFEIDVFEGENAGLVIAEIELPALDTVFSLPEWVGSEITHLHQLSNRALAKLPWSRWSTESQQDVQNIE